MDPSINKNQSHFNPNPIDYGQSKPIQDNKMAPNWRSRTVRQQQRQELTERVFVNTPKPPPTPFPKPVALPSSRGGISGTSAPPRPPRPTAPARPLPAVPKREPPPRPPRPGIPTGSQQPSVTVGEKPPRPPRPPRPTVTGAPSQSRVDFSRPRFSTEAPSPRMAPPPTDPLPPIPTEERSHIFSKTYLSGKQEKIKEAFFTVFNKVRGKGREAETVEKAPERHSKEGLAALLKKPLFGADKKTLDPETILKQGESPLKSYLDQPAKHVDISGKLNTRQVVDELDKAFTESFLHVKDTEFRQKAFGNNTEVEVEGRKGLVKEFVSPNLTNMTRLFNKTSTYFGDRVVEAGIREVDAGKSDEQVMQAFEKEFNQTVDIAYQLYKRGNHQAAQAVFSSTGAGTFNTIRKITENSKFKELEKFYDPSGNYENYRKRKNLGKVPIMTSFYSELEKMYETKASGEIIAEGIKSKVYDYQDKLKSPEKPTTDFVKQLYESDIDTDATYAKYSAADKPNLQTVMRRF